MAQTGWRKPTPGLVHADRLAQCGEQSAIPKSRAITAVKKISAAIGLKSQDMVLLDIFGAITQAQDWEKGRRPIIWPSNNMLMEQTGFSLSTLQRHVRKLCDAGVISIAESPNGKRWGRRDKDGVIIEAYGIDLAGSDSHAYNVVLINFFQNSVMCDSLVVIRELLKRDRNYQIFFMKILWQRFFRGIRESFLPRM